VTFFQPDLIFFPTPERRETTTITEEIMSEKKKLMSVEDTRLTYMAGVLLKEIADGLSQRKFEFETPEGPVTLELPKEVDVECSVKQKAKDDATKTKLEIEISWNS
jgi:amphi-Trp domain-containing protein